MAQSNEQTKIDKLLETAPRLEPIYADLLLRRTYQDEYGIYDHQKPERVPFASQRFHEKEDVIEGGMYLSYMRRFYNAKIGEKMNISWDDFLAKPMWEADFILELVTSGNSSEDAAISKLLKETGKS